ncbi:MAG: hypothetical protein IJA34_10980 [Lachnospiraceae bacterium]|nr:hypothetical protein [Lachnospiraceae bacterium]
MLLKKKTENYYLTLFPKKIVVSTELKKFYKVFTQDFNYIKEKFDCLKLDLYDSDITKEIIEPVINNEIVKINKQKVDRLITAQNIVVEVNTHLKLIDKVLVDLNAILKDLE